MLGHFIAMLPLHLGDEEAGVATRVFRKIQTKCRRIWKDVTHLRELDLEGAGWLMLNLCISPSKVMRNTAWHKRKFSLSVHLLLNPSFIVVPLNRNKRTMVT